MNGDLEYAKSSIQELFYLLPLDTKEQVQAMVEIAEVVQRIPEWTEQLMEENYQQLKEKLPGQREEEEGRYYDWHYQTIFLLCT